MELGGSDGSECFRDLSMGKFTKIDESLLAELESLPSGGGADAGSGNLRESKSEAAG